MIFLITVSFFFIYYISLDSQNKSEEHLRVNDKDNLESNKNYKKTKIR